MLEHGQPSGYAPWRRVNHMVMTACIVCPVTNLNPTNSLVWTSGRSITRKSRNGPLHSQRGRNGINPLSPSQENDSAPQGWHRPTQSNGHACGGAGERGTGSASDAAAWSAGAASAISAMVEEHALIDLGEKAWVSAKIV